MNNPTAIVRSLVIYAVCLPLAIVLGYFLASANESDYGAVAAVLCFLLLPLLLRYHHTWLIVVANMSLVVPFLTGRPNLFLLLAILSFGIAMLQYIIDRRRHQFLAPAMLTCPVVCLTAIVIGTAALRGGIGLRSMGSEIYGGGKYIIICVAVLAFFALTARRIPQDKAGWFITAYFLGTLTLAVGDLAYYLPGSWALLFAFFPGGSSAMQTLYTGSGPESGLVRLGGLAFATPAVIYALVARYGITGVFAARHPWRPLLMITMLLVGLLGGFRSVLVQFALLFSVLFYLEGLVRSKYLLVVLGGGILLGTVTIAYVEKMPLSVQRALSWLPVDVDPYARADAQASVEWRLQLWSQLIPQIPEYLVLGKGYGFSSSDLVAIQINPNTGKYAEGSEMAADYHNGPLSVIIPFGIWGVLAWLWLMVAGWRVMYRNYRYGDPSLLQWNRFLFAFYVMKVCFFFLVFGALPNDITALLFLAGLSISINGGMAAPPVPAPALPKLRPEKGEAPRRIGLAVG